MSTYAVILPAAGRGLRFKDKNFKKPFVPLDGRAVWLHAAERFRKRDDVKQVIVIISEEDREYFQMQFGANVAILGFEVVTGGQQRADSVRAALDRVKPEADFVVVHDAVRPVLADVWIDQVFRAAEKSGAAILATPVTSTLKRVDTSHTVTETVDRHQLWEAQTPQVFRRQLLLDAYAQADIAAATDDAELVQRSGHPVTVVAGSPLNLKITTREDLKLAGLALKSLPKSQLGGPAHPFADDDRWR